MFTVLTEILSDICDIHIPGTSLPLKRICMKCGTGSRGMKDAWNCLLPRFCTLHGMVPSFTIISRLPDPAYWASTEEEKNTDVKA